jgi:glycerol-3-phosphate dehydrogenase
MLSIFGGKITTYRKLAEHALGLLRPHLPAAGADWTAGATLPGGDMPGQDFDAFVASLVASRPELPRPLLRRLARAYGTRVSALLGDARTMADLGQGFGGDLTAAEIDYLVAEEWAATAEDILYRRSKLGLHLPSDGLARIDAYLTERGVRAG